MIVEIDLGEFDLLWVKGLGIHTEPMVLGGDHDLAREQIFHRLVGPAMAKFQLEGSASEGQAQELVTQADSNARLFPDERSDRLDGIRDALWISGAVRQEDSIGLMGEDGLSRAGSG